MATLAADRLAQRHQREVATVAAGVTSVVVQTALGADPADISTWYWGAVDGLVSRIAFGYAQTRGSAMSFLPRHAALSGASGLEMVPGSMNAGALRTSLQVTGPVAFKTAIAGGADTEAALRSMATQMGGVADRTVRAGDRDVVERTATEGRGVVGWRRRLSGRACGFCAMLASRGAVYVSKASATVASRGTRYHDHCHCWAEPLYRREQEPAEVRLLQAQWSRVTAGHSGADARRVWRRHWETKATPAARRRFGVAEPSRRAAEVTRLAGDVDLSRLTVPELQAMARQQGIPGVAKMRKQELVDALGAPAPVKAAKAATKTAPAKATPRKLRPESSPMLTPEELSVYEARRAATAQLGLVGELAANGASARAVTSRMRTSLRRVNEDIVPVDAAGNVLAGSADAATARYVWRRPGGDVDLSLPMPRAWAGDEILAAEFEAASRMARTAVAVERAARAGDDILAAARAASPVKAAKAARGGTMTPTYAQRQQAVRDVIEQPGSKTQALEQGQQGKTTLVTAPDGRKAVHKSFDHDALRRVDAEELGARIADAVGVRAPTVVRVADNAVGMEFIPGTVARRDAAIPAAVVGSDDGKLIGLADFLMHNSDRNGNWIRLANGRLAVIDHTSAFVATGGSMRTRGLSTEFADYLSPNRHVGLHARRLHESIDLAPQDLAVIRARLEALQPEFVARGRQDWYDAMLRNLDDIEARAVGTRTILGPVKAAKKAAPRKAATPATGQSWTAPDRAPVRTKARQGQAGGRISGEVEGKGAFDHAEVLATLDVESVGRYLDWHDFNKDELVSIVARLRNIDAGAPGADVLAWIRSSSKDELRTMVERNVVSILGKDQARVAATRAGAAKAARASKTAPVKKAAPTATQRPATSDAAYDARVARLERVADGEPTSSRRLEGGVSAAPTLETYADGQRLVRKDYSTSSPDAIRRKPGVDADAEVLAPQVVEAFDVRAAATGRGRHRDELIQEFVPGESFTERYGDTFKFRAGEEAQHQATMRKFAELADTPEGRRLGLADYVMGNPDRGSGNFIITPGGRIVAIDHGQAFSVLEGTRFPAGGAEFTRFLRDSFGLRREIPEFTSAEIRVFRERLEALEPLFRDAGHPAWHRSALRRLREVEKRVIAAERSAVAAAKKAAPKAAPAKATPAKASPAAPAKAAKKTTPPPAGPPVDSGKLSPQASRLPKVTDPQDIRTQAMAANPRYGQAYNGPMTPEIERAGAATYTQNCTRVVIAYEMRRRGIRVTAGAGTPLGETTASYVRTFRLDGKYATRVADDLGRSMSARQVAAEVESWPRGARGIVTMQGHTINVERDMVTGKAVFIDAQSAASKNPVMNLAAFQRRAQARGAPTDKWMAVARIDDLDLSDYGLHYVEAPELDIADGLVAKTEYPQDPALDRWSTFEEMAEMTPDDRYP